MAVEDEMVWFEDRLAADRFGSLDRRKHNLLQNSPNVDIQSRYHTVALGEKNSIVPHARPYPLQVFLTLFYSFMK